MSTDFIASTALRLFWDSRRSKDMKKIQFIIALSINLFFISSAHAEGMCREGEAAIFNCEMQRSISSLCESKDSSVVSYRNGIGEKVNIEISSDGANERKVFYFSNTPYAGGGEAHIRFSQSGYTYYLYDKTIKSNDGPEFSAGIVVYRGERKISNLICNNDASIRQSAYHDIDKENYRSIGAK
jgi:hypothetical protein